MASAAILIGGQATRFGGQDKGALIVEGRPIVDRQIRELSQVTDDILIVGQRASPMPSAGTPAIIIRHVADGARRQGPLAGLDAALFHGRDDVVLVVACDMPFITADLLAHLLSRVGGADAVVPKTDRGYHPLCAVYTRACQPAIRRRLAAGQLAVRRLLDDVRVQVVEASEIEAFGDPRRLLANVNTPAEYEALRAPQGHEV